MSADGEVVAEIEVEEIEEIEVEVDGEAQETQGDNAQSDKPKRERKQIERLEDLVEVQKPDEYKYRTEKEEAQGKLDVVLGKMATLTAQIDKLSDQRKIAVDARRAVQDKQAELKSQRSEAYEKSVGAQEQLEQIEKQRAEKRRALEQHKAGLKFTKIEDLDTAVKKIETKLLGGGVSADVSAKLRKDLTTLKSQRPRVLAYAAMRQLAEAEKVDTDGINKQIEKEANMTRDIRDQERQLQKDFTENRKIENHARKEIEGLIKERKALGKEKYEFGNIVYNLDRDYNRKERAYTRYIETLKYLKRKKAREERAARDAEWKEARDAEDPEEIVKKIPYAKELQLCDDLIRYCNSLLGIKTDAKETEVTAGGVKANVVDIAASRNNAFKGKSVVTSASKEDTEADEWVAAAREIAAPKKKRNRAKKEKQIINHIPDIFAQFKAIKLEPPLLKSSVEATKEALQQRKEYYESAPPPEVKKAKEPAKAEAETEAPEVVEAENKERVRNRRQSVQLMDAEQLRRVSEMAESENAAATEATKERRASVQMATDAVEEERKRRIEAEQANTEVEVEERKKNQRRASLMLDEEQQRRIAEYEEKVAKEKTQKNAAKTNSNEDSLTSQLQAAEKSRTGGSKGGKKDKKEGKKPQELDALSALLQAAEKSRTSKK